MRIGVGRYMQNFASAGGEAAVSDAQVYDEELALAALAEPLGFDTVWSTSHYFSPYQMTGNALQQATFMAGRTKTIDVGTMAMILPWQHPLHVATDVAVLDQMLAGRRLFLGVGRGAFPQEFASFGIPFEEASARFLESIEIVKLALTEERFSYEGRYYSVPPTSIRPRPRHAARLVGDLLVAWSATTPLPPAAHLGVDVLTVGSRRGSRLRRDVRPFQAFRASRGWSPARPTLMTFVACTPTDAEGRQQIEQHVREFLHEGGRHGAAAPLSPAARVRDAARTVAERFGRRTLPENHVWGTPERCLARLRELHEAVAPREVIACFRYGSLTHEQAERSMRLFAERVLPVAQSWEA